MNAKLTATSTAPAGQNLRADLAQLLADLADNSLAKTQAAHQVGQDTPQGEKYYAQGHAYGNAAMWLQMVLDANPE